MREVLDVSSIRRGRQGRRSRRFVQHARLMHGQWVVLSKLGAGRGWEVEVSSPGAAPVLMYPGSLPRAAWAAGRFGCWSLGDGSTTFRLPDLRGEFFRGWGEARGIDIDRVAPKAGLAGRIPGR